ncbi:MAG: hypothetical protein K0Q66_1431 [Chitinophagaceae bacterium]|jgi:outer membrane protein OmpA-like peptidoglycan-associated protein|nr:hypothetical protein [Chitinophagaceae bacterium]
MKTRLLPAIIAVFICTSPSWAQNKQKKDTLKTAEVEVYIVDAKEAPRKGETILFTAHSRKKTYTGRSGQDGTLKLKLPVGDDYDVFVKAFSDTSKFGTLNIPPLADGEYFQDPFSIDIVYEPAKNYTLDNVEFDVGKSTLRASSFKELDELVSYLKWREGEKIEIAGHTDNAGSDADNLKLSQARAESVRSYLVKKGIAAARIVAKGYGESEPVADNATAQGRQKNRRTEVRVLE